MASTGRRSTYKASIRKIARFCDSITEDTDIVDIQTNNERLMDLWNKYETVHMQIVDTTGEQNLSFENIEYHDTETLVMAAHSRFKKEIKRRSFSSSSQQNQSSSDVTRLNVSGDDQSNSSGLRVPRIEIPEFDGKYTDWPSFRDLFETMVGGNKKVPNVQKLSYLKKLIVGDIQEVD